MTGATVSVKVLEVLPLEIRASTKRAPANRSGHCLLRRDDQAKSSIAGLPIALSNCVQPTQQISHPSPLLGDVQSRDAAAFLRLYDLHGPSLYALLLHGGMDRKQAGDALKQLFDHLWSGAIELHDERTILLELARQVNAMLHVRTIAPETRTSRLYAVKTP